MSQYELGMYEGIRSFEPPCPNAQVDHQNGSSVYTCGSRVCCAMIPDKDGRLSLDSRIMADCPLIDRSQDD